MLSLYTALYILYLKHFTLNNKTVELYDGPCQNNRPPREDPEVKTRMCPPYPQRDRKRRLNGAVCRYHRIKRVARVGARTGTLKNPTKCLWR